MKFSVISLDDAVNALKNGHRLHNSLVLTIDDGWHGVELIAAPLLEQYGFPWTLYLTTYYAQKQTQVSNVAIQYLCWKTSCTEIDLTALGGSADEKMSINNAQDKALLSARLIELEQKLPTAQDRQAFLRQIGSLLKIHNETIEKVRMFHLLNMSSIKKMQGMGADIQLHTHRHTMGKGVKEIIISEIVENRRIIQDVCQNNAQHFCFPSGEYTRDYFPALTLSDVVSATTCKRGLVYPGANLLELSRFLDGENIAEIEFEAELSGFSELLRKMRIELFSFSKT